jgi:hypothetical protein
MSDTSDTLWQCRNERCGATLRAADLRRVMAPGIALQVCPHCGGPVTSTGAQEHVSENGKPEKLASSFASALVYPFRGWGLVALGLGTFLVGLLAFGLPFLYGYIISIFVYGYLCSYFFDIVHTTAIDEDRPPALQDSADWWEDILQPILLVVSVTVLCFAPSFLYFIMYLVHCWYEGWVPDLSEPICMWGVLCLALISAFYYPMALLAVIMHNARRAADPRLVIAAIGRVPWPYLLVCGFMVLTGLVQIGFGLAFPHGSLLAHFTAVFLKLWGAMVGMRLLGLLYRTNKEKLGWL